MQWLITQCLHRHGEARLKPGAKHLSCHPLCPWMFGRRLGQKQIRILTNRQVSDVAIPSRSLTHCTKMAIYAFVSL